MKKQKIILRLLQTLIFFIFAQPIFAADIDRVNIHGFISQGYLKSTENNFYANTKDGTFEFNEIGINFTTDITDNIHVGIQLFAKDLGKMGNDRPQINWAYADYRFKDFLGLRAGLMKIPLGLYNDIRDMDVLRPNIFYPNGIYNESWRDIISSAKGVGLYGNFEINFLGKLKYIFQHGVPEAKTEEGYTYLLEEQLEEVASGTGITANTTRITFDPGFSYTLSLVSPFSVNGLTLRSSGIIADYDNYVTIKPLAGEYLLSIHTEFHVLSLEYSWKDFTLTSEYMRAHFNIEFEDFNLKDFGAAPAYKGLTYYTSLSYDITDRFEIYLCYSNFYNDENDRSGSNLEGYDHWFRRWYEEYIISVRFDINDNWILKGETHFNNGASTLLNRNQGEPSDNEYGRPIYPYKQHWMLFAFKLSYTF